MSPCTRRHGRECWNPASTLDVALAGGVLRTTAGFVYVRMHGPDHDHLYGGSYSDDDLHWWADRICEWSDDDRDVLVYFNNDGEGNAVHNARTLRWVLGI